MGAQGKTIHITPRNMAVFYQKIKEKKKRSEFGWKWSEMNEYRH